MNPRSMMVIHQFHPIASGAELQAERLAIKLVGLGHTIHVLTQYREEGSLPEENFHGVKVHRVSFPLAFEIFSNVEHTFRYLVLNRHNFDVLHVHQAFGHAVVSIVMAKVFRKRCIVKIACAGSFGDLSEFSKFPGFKWAHRILQQADRMIAVSTEVRVELIEWGFQERKIELIPNGVDIDFFKRNQQLALKNPVRFILIGRRTPQKGVDLALRAAQLLLQQGYGALFEIKFYGMDFDEHDYRSLSKELGVTHCVEFLPPVDTIREEMLKAHALILPSRGEGMPNVLLECMSMEMPVIASRVSGVIDIIEDGKDGLLIPVDSFEALADAMKTIVRNPEFAVELGRQARKKVSLKFSLDSVTTQYSLLYKHLVEQNDK